MGIVLAEIKTFLRMDFCEIIWFFSAFGPIWADLIVIFLFWLIFKFIKN